MIDFLFVLMAVYLIIVCIQVLSLMWGDRHILTYTPNQIYNKTLQQKEDRTKKIINEMKNRNNPSTNKPKSPEVRGQEQKVIENEKKAVNDEKSKFINADGEA